MRICSVCEEPTDGDVVTTVLRGVPVADACPACLDAAELLIMR